MKTREDMRRQPPQRPGEQQPTRPSGPQTPSAPSVYEPREEEPVVEAPPPPPAIPTMPKIGVILSGGGARTFGHIGFLHELAKLKIPVSAIGGVEFGAPMAALYANKEQANDVEWQMFKLKEEDVVKKSLLGATSKNNDVTVLKDFIHTSFARANPESFRVPFACPSYNFQRNQAYLMNRGSIDQVMYSCMAYPPFFKSYNNQVAGVREISALAGHLRQRGANFIVFVNVLPLPAKRQLYGDLASTDNVLWSEIAGAYNKPMPGIDAVVSLDVGDYGIMDFDKRREIMNRGADSASKSLKNLSRKWGF